MLYFYYVFIAGWCLMGTTGHSNEAAPRLTNRPWGGRFSALDYVRCFCNLPSCVTTGYMCKSALGGCFSNFNLPSTPPEGDYKGRHGCLEFLDEKEVTLCGEERVGRPSTTCCYQNLCNYVDKTAPIGKTAPKTPLKQSKPPPPFYTESEVWLRAATIFVPVCGAVILFVLIALAIRILRNDIYLASSQKLGGEERGHQQRFLSGCYDNNAITIQTSSTNQCKVQETATNNRTPLLLAADNETNTRLNLLLDNSRNIIDVEKIKN